MSPHRRAHPSRGFTLIELLIVIGIIVVLMAILMPVISHVRMRAYEASSQHEMERIMQACQSYFHDFQAYPGPIPNTQLSGGSNAGNYAVPISGITGPSGKQITSSENLVLGLLGMINITPATTTPTPTLTFVSPAASAPTPTPPHDVLNLNSLHPASYHYFDYNANEISSQTGFSKDLPYAGGATTPPTDSNVPEFVDQFPDQMPILYIRAFVGGISTNSTSSGTTPSGVPVATTDISSNATVQYNYNELKDYGSYARMSSTSSQSGTWTLFAPSGIGAGSALTPSLNTPNPNLADDEATPYTDWWNSSPASGSAYYFMNPSISGAVRGKDGFMLIGAGMDRTYGTLDDDIVTP